MYLQSKIIQTKTPNLTLDQIFNLAGIKSTSLNYLVIKKDEKKTKLGIEEVKELLSWNSTKDEKTKVAVVYDSDLLTSEAQNSMLKVIEEPSPNTQIILVVKNINKLLITIRSRCQVVKDESLLQTTNYELQTFLEMNYLEREAFMYEKLMDREELSTFIEELIEHLTTSIINHPSSQSSIVQRPSSDSKTKNYKLQTLQGMIELLVKSHKSNLKNVNVKLILDNINYNLNTLNF